MNEYELSKDKMEKLRKDCMDLIQKDAAGCDIRTMLKNMYCRFYSNKTEDIGYLMADKIIGYVEEYEQEVSQSMEDLDGWYEEKVRAILEGKESCEERCNMLYGVRVGLAAIELSAAKGQEAAEEYVEGHSRKAFTAEEATEELEEKLKKELKDMLENNRLLANVLDVYADNAADTEEDIERTVIKYGEDALKFKAVIAMKAYIESGEDGYLADEIPADVTLKDITYSACAGVDTLGIAAAVENGGIEESLASRIIHAIGIVLGGMVALKIAAVAGTAVVVVGTGSILAFIGGIIVAGAILKVIGDTLMEVGGKVADISKEVVCFGARCICAAGKTIFAGIRKLAGFVGSFFRHDDGQEEVREVFEYTEPEHEKAPASQRVVMPAPTVPA